MIEAKNVFFSYGKREVLKDVSITAEDGELVVILGGNGVGKSTLIKILSGFLRPDKGEVLCSGKPISKTSTRELAKIRAVLDQEDHLNFDYTVEQLVRLGNFARGNCDCDAKVFQQSLELTGLAGFENRLYTELSGGEKRRAMIARALFQIGEEKRGKTLLLDEPSAGLDPAAAHVIMKAAKFVSSRGASVVAVLHDPNLAVSYADKVALMKNSQIFAFGEVEETLNTENLESTYDTKCEVFPLCLENEALPSDNKRIFINFPRP